MRVLSRIPRIKKEKAHPLFRKKMKAIAIAIMRNRAAIIKTLFYSLKFYL
jgi:hypothetical protein